MNTPDTAQLSANSSDMMLKIRMDAAGEAQRRTRLAFLASTIISLTIIITVWNAYISFYRHFLFQENWPNNSVTQEAQKLLVNPSHELENAFVDFKGVSPDGPTHDCSKHRLFVQLMTGV